MMKTFKILLLCIIPILGIYSMNKLEFGKKLVIMLPGVAPGPRPGGPQGPPPEMRQPGPEADSTVVEHEIPSNPGMAGDSSLVRTPEGEHVSQAPPTRPGGEEQSKWKIRINFKRGIKNVAYLTLILAFLVELTYLADRLIRKKPLL